MNYLVPLFDGLMVSKESYNINKNVKYEIENDKLASVIFSYENILPFVFDLKKESKNVLKVKVLADNYFFLFPQTCCNNFCFKLDLKGNEILINLSNSLLVSINGNVLLNKDVDSLTFYNYEMFGSLCLIYFSGKRNFLLVIKDKEVCFADYYDECNLQDNEKVFMCKLNDCLNHGRVFHIKDNTFESYLVYLDNEELNLKNDLVAFVFLDCLLAENFKYCNELLSTEIKLQEENKVKEFFPEFDYYYPVSNEEFILIKKNTLAGIYKFEIDNKSICNIVNQSR